jgi:hypothetical protein
VDLSGAAWRKSSYSGGNGGQCVEVAAITTHTDTPEPLCAVRDSANPGGPVLAFSPGQWRAFAGRVKAGTLRLA